MGKETFSRTAYVRSFKKHASEPGHATADAERQAKITGKLNPLVDPSTYGVIRRSLLRFEQREDGLLVVAVGTPIPIETRVDTTGSMGHNVEVALEVLPNMYEFCQDVLPGYDLQIATGIFGDVCDNFVLCRPQFEMVADKIVQQLTLMVPEHGGGDSPEDPHYGLFGAAYLTDAYINRIGLKGYDFTISDAPARDRLDENQLIRIFGKEVFEKLIENGFQIKKNNLPETHEVVQDLLQRAHAFFLQVGRHDKTTDFWIRIFGQERVITLPDTRLMPQVQATIIGLTEGTLDLQSVSDFLMDNNVDKNDANRIKRSVANIPIGAQAILPNFSKRPQAGNLFVKKTDLWPINATEVEIPTKPKTNNKVEEGPIWL